jgi:hypothetical protein
VLIMIHKCLHPWAEIYQDQVNTIGTLYLSKCFRRSDQPTTKMTYLTDRMDSLTSVPMDILVKNSSNRIFLGLTEIEAG